jgi:hypothetical protein
MSQNERTTELAFEANLGLLANVAEFGALIVGEVAGNEVANTLNNERLSSNAIRNAILARVNARLAPSTGV